MIEREPWRDRARERERGSKREGGAKEREIEREREKENKTGVVKSLQDMFGAFKQSLIRNTDREILQESVDDKFGNSSNVTEGSYE